MATRISGGAAPAKRKAQAKAKPRTMDQQRKASSISTQKWAKQANYRPRAKPGPIKPNAKAALANIAADMAHKSGDKKAEAHNRRVEREAKRKPHTTLQPVAPGLRGKPGAGTPVKSKAKGFNEALPGVLRVAGHTARGIAGAVVKDPLDAAEKAGKQASEIAKGVAATAIALPIYAATDPVARAVKTGRGKQDSPGKIAKRMLDTEVDRVSKDYGPSYRNEPGARKKLQKKIEKEGVLVPALDLALAATPTSLAVGAPARAASASRVAKGGKPIRGVTRPKVRVSPHGPAIQPKQRTGAIRMAGEATVDVARVAAQKGAERRHRKTGKPLPARRALLRKGEVTPISKRAVERKLRLSAAEDVGMGERLAIARTKRLVTDAKPKAGSIRAPFRKLPEADHHAAITAAQLGIKDAQGARNIIPDRIAEIERTIATARANPKHPDAAAASHEGHEVELARLREYLENPRLFERADIRMAADAVRKPVVGPREGLSTERAATGRAGLVGPTLGVRTAAQRTSERKAAYREAKASHDAAIEAKRAEVIRQQREVDRGRLLTREAAIGKGLGGKVKVSDKATLKAIARHAGKQAKRAPLARVGGHADTLVRAERGLRVAKQELSAAKKARAKLGPLPRHEPEAPTAYEARVAAAAAERGLLPPAHVPSKFEPDEGLRVQRPTQGQANPLRHERKGSIYRTGHEDKSLARLEHDRAAAIKRGARLEAESNVLARHGRRFDNEAELNRWVQSKGMSVGDDADMVAYKPIRGLVRKDLGAKPRTVAKGKGKPGEPSPRSDMGDYVATDDVWLVPKAVRDELEDLGRLEATPPGPLRKAASLSQSALLALSPSWLQFQRVNDIVAATIGGSLQNQVRLQKLRKSLDPESREVLDIVAGGSLSREMLTPHSAAKMGAIQRILDENPTYRQAFATKNPATVLLRIGADIPTGLLRADQAVTAGFRQRQLLHNLQRAAARMDPDVGVIHGTYSRLGRAFAKGDPDQIHKLLTDPKYKAQVEEAAAKLNDVMGNWHTYTAREQRVRAGFAFYGFLRYATRMAFITLPIGHPTMGALVAQLGIIGAEDAKRIVGPDMPWGIGALYNADGTIAADFARANPLTGPLLSINKPEQLVGLATPLASIILSYALAQPVGLSDSATGYVKQFTVKGNPDDHAVGGFFGDARLRILGDNVLSLLTPYKEWARFDGRQQSDDSLPWDRRFLESHKPATQLKIDAKNKARGDDGVEGLKHNLLPLAFPSSSKNQRTQGQLITKAKVKGQRLREIDQIKRKRALETLEGEMDLEIKKLKAELDAEDPDLAEIDHEIAKLKAELGAP